ncbi:2-dehydro-3-deoxyphosphogluconate aldolase, partial [Candidatus Calescamantes bacterium]|nr:2-dehydro-3-deoxyphosphogluconate aldolase [Candidatus Calescamantes bacterium]
MREKIINLLNETKIISIIRAENSEELLNVAMALKEGGIKFIEVTMTTPGALNAIEEFCGKMEDVIIGVGSVLDSETARLSILSGAEFIVTPTLNFDVIKMCKRYS